MPRQILSPKLEKSSTSRTLLSLEHVQVTKDAENPVATVWLDYAERRNALGTSMMSQIEEAFVFLNTRFDVHVVILEGKGKSFSAGADLKDVMQRSEKTDGMDPTPRQRGYAQQQGRRLMRAIQELEAITIAKVHGHAIGGGFGLMLACDLRLVRQDTMLYFPEVDLGNFLPWGLTPMLARDLGMARAKELVLTCDMLDPTEALSLGLINKVAPDQAALDMAADELAYKIAAKPVEALQGAKMQFISMLPNTSQVQSISNSRYLTAPSLNCETNKLLAGRYWQLRGVYADAIQIRSPRKSQALTRL
jgi:enoyl-CoA hydratase/carnithine racemase